MRSAEPVRRQPEAESGAAKCPGVQPELGFRCTLAQLTNGPEELCDRPGWRVVEAYRLLLAHNEQHPRKAPRGPERPAGSSLGASRLRLHSNCRCRPSVRGATALATAAIAVVRRAAIGVAACASRVVRRRGIRHARGKSHSDRRKTKKHFARARMCASSATSGFYLSQSKLYHEKCSE